MHSLTSLSALADANTSVSLYFKQVLGNCRTVSVRTRLCFALDMPALTCKCYPSAYVQGHWQLRTAMWPRAVPMFYGDVSAGAYYCPDAAADLVALHTCSQAKTMYAHSCLRAA